MGRLRSWIRRLERAKEPESITFSLEDGSVARFSKEEVFEEALLHESRRWRAGYRGATVGPPHPVVDALRQAPESEVRRLASQYGHLIPQMVGEDRVLLGQVDRGRTRN
jgi:hypothetical protein